MVPRIPFTISESKWWRMPRQVRDAPRADAATKGDISKEPPDLTVTAALPYLAKDVWEKVFLPHTWNHLSNHSLFKGGVS